MVVPTMSGDSPDFTELGKQLEAQELDSPGGVATPTVYGQLLAIHLLHNDVVNAKFLWKRTPQAIKNAHSDLAAIWTIGQKMWQRDFPAIYETLQKDWADPLKPVMAAILESTRLRAFNLVGKAYSSISAEDFAAFMGMSVQEAVAAATSRGWEADPQTRLIAPKKEEIAVDVTMPSEQQMAKFTDFVAFLEN